MQPVAESRHAFSARICVSAIVAPQHLSGELHEPVSFSAHSRTHRYCGSRRVHHRFMRTTFRGHTHEQVYLIRRVVLHLRPQVSVRYQQLYGVR